MNVLAIGDSLFAGTEGNKPCTKEQQWIGILAKSGSWNFTNLAVAGQTVSFTQTINLANHYGVKSIWQALCCEQFYEYGTPLNFKMGSPDKTKKDEVNMILLEGGPNDFGKGVPFENGANTPTTYSCFKGAYKMIIDHLLEEYPFACIVCVTPWQSNDTTTVQGYTRNQYYCDGLIHIIKEYYAGHKRVGVIDARNFVDVSDRSLAYDNFHLNPTGMQIMASEMQPFIQQIINNDFKFSDDQLLTK